MDAHVDDLQTDHPSSRYNLAGSLRRDAVNAVRSRSKLRPELALVLGSGLGPLADDMEVDAVVPYSDIPGFGQSSAPGHAGELVLGKLAGKSVVAMRGRLHFYEGFRSQQLTFPVRIMHALGAGSLIVSNACGGLNPAWQAGDLMLQTDFINATWDNPLTGANDPGLGPRFPVMFDAYDPGYLSLARDVASAEGIDLREGIYLAIGGPSYATRAELRMYRAWGADAIGMSTVHEVIAARHEGMRVLGLSAVTDMALPEGTEHASGEDVLQSAAALGPRFRRLVAGIVARL